MSDQLTAGHAPLQFQTLITDPQDPHKYAHESLDWSPGLAESSFVVQGEKFDWNFGGPEVVAGGLLGMFLQVLRFGAC